MSARDACSRLFVVRTTLTRFGVNNSVRACLRDETHQYIVEVLLEEVCKITRNKYVEFCQPHKTADDDEEKTTKETFFFSPSFQNTHNEEGTIAVERGTDKESIKATQRQKKQHQTRPTTALNSREFPPTLGIFSKNKTKNTYVRTYLSHLILHVTAVAHLQWMMDWDKNHMHVHTYVRRPSTVPRCACRR